MKKSRLTEERIAYALRLAEGGARGGRRRRCSTTPRPVCREVVGDEPGHGRSVGDQAEAWFSGMVFTHS